MVIAPCSAGECGWRVSGIRVDDSPALLRDIWTWRTSWERVCSAM